MGNHWLARGGYDCLVGVSPQICMFKDLLHAVLCSMQYCDFRCLFIKEYQAASVCLQSVPFVFIPHV